MAWGKRTDELEGEVGSVAEHQSTGEITVIGPGARLEGLVVSGGSLRIEGEVKGEIRADGDVLVAPSATVEAEINARSLRIEGRFLGNAEVEGRAELGGTAKVEGNLSCQALLVAEGAMFNGRTTMSGGAPVISLPDVAPAEQT